MRYRWERDAGRGVERRVLTDVDRPYAVWGMVDLLRDGRWFVVTPDLGDPFFQTLDAAEGAVEAEWGIEPSEVAREG